MNSEKMAVPAGFEPATIRLEGECSIQLSYGTVMTFKRHWRPKLSSFFTFVKILSNDKQLKLQHLGISL